MDDNDEEHEVQPEICDECGFELCLKCGGCPYCKTCICDKDD